MKFFVGACLFWVVSGALSADHAKADAALVGELEKLRDSLPAGDPTRQTLTLRVADTLFDDVGEITRKPELTDAEQVQVLTLRKKALSFYQEALKGAGGLYPPVQGLLRHKVVFQVARLYAELGMSGSTQPLWQSLLDQKDLPELRREASLRLAEAAESEQDYARAEKLYTQSIELCGSGDICSYGHYRRAWTIKNQNRISQAIAEIQLALYDSRGQLREEALRDLVQFLSLEPGTDGKAALALIDGLAAKLSRPALLTDLSSAFFSAGNRPAGVLVLTLVDARAPQLQNQIKLMEELYGLRQIDRFREAFAKAQASVQALPTGLDEAQVPETAKVLYRLTVQLDGERTSRPEFVADFKATVLLYLSVFPRTHERMKMVDGWLAAETDSVKKSAQLKAWIADARIAFTDADRIRLREGRTAIAQAQKDHATVLEETAALAALAKDPARVRDYRYANARAMYELKDYARCLPVFRELAQFDVKPAAHAIESQHLALDILGQQKNYAAVIAQIATWTEKAKAVTQSLPLELRDELASMSAIAERADFELAASSGQTPEALAIFQKLCLAGRLTPQSCDNAKVVAIGTRNQPALLSVLKAQNARAELAAEYEASGHFADAAELLSQGFKGAQPTLTEYLKVATLYELDGRVAARDKTLAAATESWRKERGKKTNDATSQESLLYLTLEDSGLITAQSLSLPWNSKLREQIADELESRGKGNAESRRIVADAKVSTGPAWNAQVLAEVHRLNAAQQKINFYGKGSERKFNARLAALKKLAAYADTRLPGSEASLRVEIAKTLSKSHRDLSGEILSSPLPPELNDEQIAQVKEAIAKLAEPFEAKAKDYEVLASEQAAKVAEATTVVGPAPASAAVVQGAEVRDRAIGALHLNPLDRTALASLQSYYLAQKQRRLASYFQGRLSQIDTGDAR